MRRRSVCVMLAPACVLSGCKPSPKPEGASVAEAVRASSFTPEPGTKPFILVGAGDIGRCDRQADEGTAELVARVDGEVFTLGDNAYFEGSPAEYDRCYAPSWGKFKSRTHPAVGNHEYRTFGAGGYFGYFGAAAGEPGKGYYSYEAGPWHVVVLNSNCDDVGCEAEGPQGRWLRGDLADHKSQCSLAYFHHPLFTSPGAHGPAVEMKPLVRLLYEAGVDVMLAGHNHNYERFGPMNPDGAPDKASGIVSFVVGTGGTDFYPFSGPAARGVEARNDRTHGVLRLELYDKGYVFRFEPLEPTGFSDSGSGVCH